MTLEEFTTDITKQINDVGFSNVEIKWSDPELIVSAWNDPSIRYGSEYMRVSLDTDTIRSVVEDFKSLMKG